MAVCSASCSVTVPTHPVGAACKVTPRAGGISRLIFKSCDVTFTDITDTAEWTTKITANEVHATGYVLGQKPKGTVTKKKLADIYPEQVASGVKTINVQDYNVEAANALGEYDFWKNIFTNQHSLSFAYMTEEELLYGFYDSFVCDVDDVREDSEGNTYFDIEIQWKETGISKPTLVTGLNAVLA